MRRWALVALTCAAMLAGTVSARAHPHLLLSQTVRLVASNGQFTHVEVEWSFDPFSSDLEIAAIDDDKDGKISPKEERELGNIALPELKRFGYLLWINTGGKDERPASAPTFKARIDNPATFVPGGWAPVQDGAGPPPAAGASAPREAAKPQPAARPCRRY